MLTRETGIRPYKRSVGEKMTEETDLQRARRMVKSGKLIMRDNPEKAFALFINASDILDALMRWTEMQEPLELAWVVQVDFMGRAGIKNEQFERLAQHARIHALCSAMDNVHA